jgi:hypothetical protein
MADSDEAPTGGTAPVAPIDFRSALHPFEGSRLILALSASFVVLGGGVALAVVTIRPFDPALLIVYALVGIITIISIWVALQVQRARLLGNSIRVGPDSLPDVHTALATVRQQLAYDRRVDVYVAAEVKDKATWLSFLGHRVILLEGDFVAGLLSSEGQAGLRFITGSFIGALKARHARLLPILILLQIFDSVKFLALFVNPYLRATRHSGDQLGYLCSGDLKVAISAAGRLLVGKDVEPDLGVRGVLDQVTSVQTRFWPRLAQVLTQTPHLVNRYLNILAFSARVVPQDFHAFTQNLSEDTRQRLDLLLATNPHAKQQSPWRSQLPQVDGSNLPQAPPEGPARSTDRWLLLATATALVIAIATAVFVLLRPTDVPAAKLALSTSKAKIGDTYSAIASGFSPGENVQFSWTGRTNGVMGVFPTDSDGSASNQVWERDPPGNYTIAVTGLTSRRTTSAELQVVANTGAAQLALSTSQVKIGDTYFATASGFSPGENVQFSWTGPTNGVMGVFRTDSNGGATPDGIVEEDPPGHYTITVTGLTSGRTTLADLQVIQPGN